MKGKKSWDWSDDPKNSVQNSRRMIEIIFMSQTSTASIIRLLHRLPWAKPTGTLAIANSYHQECNHHYLFQSFLSKRIKAGKPKRIEETRWDFFVETLCLCDFVVQTSSNKKNSSNSTNSSLTSERSMIICCQAWHYKTILRQLHHLPPRKTFRAFHRFYVELW